MILLASASASASVQAGQLADRAAQKTCALEKCWDEVFPQLTKTTTDAAKAIKAYTTRIETQLSDTLHHDSSAAAEKIALDYRLTLLEQFLKECEDLKLGPDFPRHVIIVGHPTTPDGVGFELVAQTEIGKLSFKLCGSKKGEEREKCKRQIVVKRNVDGESLFQYLRLLGPGSIKSLQYIGHGIDDALVMGQNNLLLPENWNPSLKISKDEWMLRHTGVVYSDGLKLIAADGKSLGGELARTMAPGASVNFMACKAGQKFAPALKSVLGESIDVSATQSNMHFEYLDEDGKWKPMGGSPNAKVWRLAPDGAGIFGKVGSTPTDKIKAKDALTPKPAASTVASSDAATQGVLIKAMLGSGIAAMVDQGRKFVAFSKEERDQLAKLFGSRVEGRKFLAGKEPTHKDAQETFDLAIEKAPNASAKERLTAMKAKFESCVEESLRIYY